MPSAEDDWKIGIPGFDRLGDLDCFANHGTGDERDSKTQSIANLLEDSFFVVRSDGGIDEDNLIAGTDQRRGNSENT